ncbi:MAG: CoA transferase [Bacteroidota bacterium]|nr:CoA transferase [Bacteroidota bacterium]
MFQDLLVIETAGVLAGPAVGMQFAELGARVIKIENKRAGGDVTRKWKLPSEDQGSSISAYFSSVNWGKQHLFLDLKDQEDRDQFDRLIEKADVLISNHLPQDANALGLSRDRLKGLNPKLIHGHITGFSDQPDRPAYDVVLQAETGYISMTGTDTAHLAKLPIAMIDVLAAHQLKEGILISLLQRGRTGKGAYVQVSLEKAALSGLINQASNFLMAGHVAAPIGTLHPNIAPYGETFFCQDRERMILAVGSDVQFRSLCSVLGSIELPDDLRFHTNIDRVRSRTELAVLLQERITARSRTELLTELEKAGVPAGAVRSINEVMGTSAAQEMILDQVIDGRATQRIKGNAFSITEW